MSNVDQMHEILKRHSDRLRTAIRQRRAELGDTEKDVNDRFYANMKSRGLSAPTAIMTKVRDTRRDFILNREEAECMADAIKLDVALLLPPDMPQRELPIAGESTPPLPAVQELPGVQTEQPHSGQNDDASPTLPPAPVEQVQEAKRQETTGAYKIGFGFYQAKDGLRFFLNMHLTQAQFERLTLAIPEYMMTCEREGDLVHCRTNLPIFNYQAELLTRAVYGA